VAQLIRQGFRLALALRAVKISDAINKEKQ